MAQTLGAAIFDHNSFRSQMLDLLNQRNGDSPTRCMDPVINIVLEALLALAHEQGRTKIYVGEIAACVNALLKARKESVQFEARSVGDLLRKVGVFTEGLGSAGRGITLMVATRRQIHQLARAHQVPAAPSPAMANGAWMESSGTSCCIPGSGPRIASPSF